MTEPQSSRRTILSICTVGLLALIGTVVVTPVVAFIISPLRKNGNTGAAGGTFADAGALDSLPLGEWKRVPLEITRQDGWAKSTESRAVWVNRQGLGEQDVLVLSPICPHLGCPITLAAAPAAAAPAAAAAAAAADSIQFRCPCHGGTFSATDGKQISGPPPRDMDRLDHEVRDDGHLWVRWQDFKISVPQRIPVQI
jgi:Rieske Fe-S protein